MRQRALRLCLALLATLLLQPALSGRALAWWNGDWSYRMKVNADAGPKGANVTEPVGRTQILIRLTSGNFNFATAKDDGADLRVVAADDKTPLHFHIERYDGLVEQVGLLWVDMPDLAPGTQTSLYLYWGNKNAQFASDNRATYDADQVLVWHFNEDNGLPKDSTGYGNNALTPGHRDTAGDIGFGTKFDGTTPIRLNPSPSLAVAAGQTMTWTMWVRPADGVKDGVLYTQADGGNVLTIGLAGGVAYAQIATPAGTQRTSAGAALPDGWRHIAVTASDALRVYVDGALRGEVAGPLPAMQGIYTLGGALPAAAPPAPTDPNAPPASTSAVTATPPPAPADPNAPAATPAVTPAAAQTAPVGPNFSGEVDEFQISKVVRQTGAFQLAANNQGLNASLLSFDVAEESSVFGSGYIGIILRSVTPDAWVVIGLLSVMAAITWVVMIGKATFLGGLRRANARFREEYRRSLSAAHGDNRAAFMEITDAKVPMLRRSSLYRLYQVGSRELSERLAGGVVEAQGGLAPQSIAAMRAVIDSQLARESARCNRLMVMLTIAIAGGPFLGLLGTVVGVMITFAAIAAAGDVNVNAIAPGVSAALLATVAGLAVAIPALFGYNYLLTQIRDVTTEMNSFVEELVTRMGEVYRPMAGRTQPQPQLQAGE